MVRDMGAPSWGWMETDAANGGDAGAFNAPLQQLPVAVGANVMPASSSSSPLQCASHWPSDRCPHLSLHVTFSFELALAITHLVPLAGRLPRSSMNSELRRQLAAGSS